MPYDEIDRVGDIKAGDIIKWEVITLRARKSNLLTRKLARLGEAL